MKTIQRAGAFIDVVLETDVLVVAADPEGWQRPASARAGARTALIDRTLLRGNITQVGVEDLTWYRARADSDCEGMVSSSCNGEGPWARP